MESAGCSKDEYARYMILEIAKNIKINRVKIKYNRDRFINKMINTDFPDKINILKYFYGVDSVK